jgi:hypothetical protein
MPIPSDYKSIFKGNALKTLYLHEKDYTPKIILLKNDRQIHYTKADDISNTHVIVNGENIDLKHILDIYKKSDGPFTFNGGRKLSKRRSLRKSKKQRKSQKYKK